MGWWRTSRRCWRRPSCAPCAARKSVEVRLAWANKGELTSRIEPFGGTGFDFRFAVGDDRTDEDMFERLPPDAWTVHVGEASSRARFRLPNPAAVLAQLVAALPPAEALVMPSSRGLSHPVAIPRSALPRHTH